MSAGEKGEASSDYKFDLLVEMLNKMQNKMTRLETESAEVGSLLNVKNVSAQKKVTIKIGRAHV